MKFNKNISLAYYNLIHKSKYSVKMISSILLILIIMNVSVLFIEGIEKYYEKLVVDNAGKNNIYFELAISHDGQILDEDLEMLEQVRIISGVAEPVIYEEMDIRKYIENDSDMFLSTKRIKIMKEDTKTSWVGKKDAPVSVCYLGESSSYFTESDKRRFSYYYPEEKLMLEGTEIQECGDIVVSDKFLSDFGIDDYNNLVNEKFTIYVDGEVYLKNVRLSGVYNTKISEIDRIKYFSPIIYCEDFSNISSLPIQKLSVCVPLDDFMVGKNVSESLEKLNLSSKVYFDEDNAEVFVYINHIKQLLYYIIFLVMFFVIIAMFLSLCGVLFSRIRENTPYYAMMRAMGMRKADLLLLLFIEQLLLVSVSAFFSLPLVVGGLILVNHLLQNILGADILVTFFDFVGINVGCLIIVFVGLVMVTMMFLFTNQKKEISVLLKG